MMLSRVVTVMALAGLGLVACASEPPPPPPEPIVRVDTVVVTREVPPPLPTGTPAEVCLATGQSVDVRISAAGDTLVGSQRVRLQDLGRGVGFAGNYAADESWFIQDESIVFENRRYEQFGTPSSQDCGDIKIVGTHNGVNLFADAAADAPYETIYVPVRPGVFQPYRAQVGRVRG